MKVRFARIEEVTAAHKAGHAAAAMSLVFRLSQ
jgi:hypothetical protein